MTTFRDVPNWYNMRIQKMYRKNAKIILGCPDVLKRNHLIHGCTKCLKVRPRIDEAPVQYVFDRMYSINDSSYERFCLRTFVTRGRQVCTSVEFPLPKITSQHITRIPQFYDPAAGLVYDCFTSEEDIEKNSSIYYVRKAHKVCAEYGLTYCQMLITRKEFVVINQAPINGFDELSYKLLVEFNKQK